MRSLFEEIVNEVLYSANHPYKMQHPDELFGYNLEFFKAIKPVEKMQSEMSKLNIAHFPKKDD